MAANFWCMQSDLASSNAVVLWGSFGSMSLMLTNEWASGLGELQTKTRLSPSGKINCVLKWALKSIFFSLIWQHLIWFSPPSPPLPLPLGLAHWCWGWRDQWDFLAVWEELLISLQSEFPGWYHHWHHTCSFLLYCFLLSLGGPQSPVLFSCPFLIHDAGLVILPPVSLTLLFLFYSASGCLLRSSLIHHL